MTNKLERVIAALRTEALMLEAHAKKLSEMANQDLTQLAKEEADKAESISRQIAAMRDRS